MKKTSIFALLTAALTLASCVLEPLTPEDLLSPGQDGKTLFFSIVDGVPATRAAAAEDTVTRGSVIELGVMEDGRPFRFEESVTRLAIPSGNVATKGAPATNANVGALYGSFNAVAYEGTSSVTIDNQSEFTFDYQNDSGKWTHAFKSYPWATRTAMFFFMYMPEKPAGTTFDPTDKTISFSYTIDDAAGQEDLLFAGCAATKAAFESDPMAGIPVTFYHALAGVKFAIGNDSNGTVIKQVTLKHIAKNGSAVVNVGDSPSVSWSVPGSPSEDYTLTVPEGTFSAGDDLNEEDLSLTFWLIPQTLSDDAELEVTYAINGGAKRTVSAKINEALGGTLALAAGELHTFTLNPDEVNVSITDEIAGGKKQNVVITNTGNVAAYLRAVIVANWQDDYGNIVAAWDFDPSEFDGLPGTGWTLGSDGFYYTDDVVPAGEDAPTLFNTYTPPADPPVGGAHLVMDIAVQAVNVKPISWAE